MFHNPLNYAHGLLDELEGAVRAGRHEVAAEVRKELAAVRPVVAALNPEQLGEDAKVVHARLSARLASLDEADADTRTEQPPAGATAETKPAGRPRTAKATGAPETAAPARPE